jgi:hypothetical protein
VLGAVTDSVTLAVTEGEKFVEIIESVPRGVVVPRVVLMAGLLSSEVFIAGVFALLEEAVIVTLVELATYSPAVVEILASAVVGGFEVDTPEVVPTELDVVYEETPWTDTFESYTELFAEVREEEEEEEEALGRAAGTEDYAVLDELAESFVKEVAMAGAEEAAANPRFRAELESLSVGLTTPMINGV